jgi:hypothetical protein
MSQGPNYSENLYNRLAGNMELFEKNISEYSFSQLANFLLLFHYKKTSNPGFDRLAKKTALQFGNVHWLEFQLYQKNIDPVFKEHPEKEQINREEKIEQSVVNFPEEIIQHETFPAEIKEVIETAETAEDRFQKNGNETNSEDTPPVLENTITEETYGDPENTTAILSGSNSIMENNADDIDSEENGAIAFEPLHTVDYFASQGIKINDELITNDKLGSQMKSFTAWLKSMKKLHPGRLAEQNIATEKLIQTSAEESNVNTEVLTEAMAEVLIKQDKKEKAIEMFSKLSLINPSKSAYFAAKIESIKSS